MGNTISGPHQPRPLTPRQKLDSDEKAVTAFVQDAVERSETDHQHVHDLLVHLGDAGKVVRDHKPVPQGEATNMLQVRRTWAKVHRYANMIAESVTCATAPGGGAVAPLTASMLRQLREGVEGWSAALDAVKQQMPRKAAATSQIQGTPPPSNLIEWVEIPGGSFKYGRSQEDVKLPTFEIGKYPVTNGQFRKFIEATGYQTEGPWDHEAGPGRDDHPVVNVSHNDAKAFCEWAGCRLPQENEWEKAARGTDGREYPWGDEWDPHKCQFAAEDSAPVTAHPHGASPYGVMDMAGNVLEWTDTSHMMKPGSILIKGGAWTNLNHGSFSTWRWSHDVPSSYYPGFGFRVARDVKTPPADEWNLTR